ncbi:MAG: hypothetical protein WC655_20205 [Candidatus Hydrogenedentales bacterium]
MFTFEPGGRLWWYVARMALAAIAGALIVSTIAQPLFGTHDPRVDMLESNFLLAAFGMVVVAPPIETMLMALFFGIATFFSGNVRRLAVVSCVFWGLLHLVNSPVNALGVVWPFYIMSRAYLAWRPRGFWKAVGTTTLIHAAINALAMVIAGIALALDGPSTSELPPMPEQTGIVQYTQYVP